MGIHPYVLQAGLLICSAAAIAMTTRSNPLIRRIGAGVGIFGQTFWFAWLKIEDFGALALAIWFLMVYIYVFATSFKVSKIYLVKLMFHTPERRVRLRVIASNPEEIARAQAELGMVVPCAMEIVDDPHDPTQILSLKDFKERLLHQQRIQQSELVGQ